EPPSWWSGMEKDTIQLLIYGDDFTDYEINNSPKGIEIIDQKIYSNPSYYKLTIKVTKSGSYLFEFTNKKFFNNSNANFEFIVKGKNKREIPKIDASDVVYLLMVDRFSDGNKENNKIPNHKDPIRIKHKWGRKGGDIDGIINHLDYLLDLGISTLWLTPIYENNYINCYHGYTPTDLYKVEPHFGDLNTYKKLVDKCHENNIKIIQDHIINHISPSHPLAKNPPNSDWINGTSKDHHNCNYEINDITNYYGIQNKREFTQSGWFASYLADMNLKNTEVVEYFINHAIWWIETAQIDGIREDTFLYSDRIGAAKFVYEIKKEYPNLFVVGETMEFNRIKLSYFFNNNPKLNNHLSSVTDFAFSSLIYKLIMNEIPVREFYEELSNDFIYRSPNMMLTFMDNHDMGRFFSDVNENISQYLSAFTLIFGLRGIPQIYYGDEIGITGAHDPENRKEFPGGFSYTDHNSFYDSTRTENENIIHNQFKKFINFRKNHADLFLSKMKHVMLDISVYLVIRENNNRQLLIFYNDNENSEIINLHKELKNLVFQDVKIIEVIAPKNNSKKILINDEIHIPEQTAVMIYIENKISETKK
ncbi:MAG: alpha-amylase family glycosyl hydrolase, partial [Candidatus Marinimicrobia bacterium]|nr:alpha-amylase family glycosyl hydrolase [Candidatus Neomarinimicrobiota bacterium]